MTDDELLQRMSTRVPPTARLLGMEMLSVSIAEGQTRMRFPVKPEFCNPMGNMQGGIIAAMLDDAAATAVIAHSGERIVVPTIEFKVSFLAPARVGGWVHVEGRVVKRGRTIAFAEADMMDETGRLLARMSTSVMPQPMPANAMLVDAG
ncbi:PaaI family thioesterase [Sandaracinobacteroides saxicola]|uniref:PaaI family thioesterase n=2 Tax=Sandaracinobacteroides saxicola TaxID=2759707 RepID=A0A7G5IMY3_9SPHN|nr:PaaI family thioesterase [Sandaracinobacteroides saxicola]